MKNRTKKIISVILAILLFMSCPHYVYASEHGGGGGTDHNSDFITDSGTINIKDDGVVMYYIEYILSQIGAVIFDHDITKVMANDQTMKEYISKGKFDANKNTVTFPKETVIYVKETFDDYAKEENSKEENGGFYLLPTTPISEVPVDRFLNAQQMRTFRNIVIEKGCLVVRVRYGAPIRFVDPFSDPNHPIFLIGDLSNLNSLKEYPYMPVSSSFFCVNDWKTHSYRVQTFPEQDKIYTSIAY